MQSTTIDLYALEELNQDAQRAAHEEYNLAMGGLAEDLQLSAEEQGRALERFSAAVPWARGEWRNVHGPGTEVWRFDAVDAFEALGHLDARADPDAWDWWDVRPAEGFNRWMDDHAEELERLEGICRDYSDYQQELEPGEPDAMWHEAAEAEGLICEICGKALDLAAEAVNSDWDAEVNNLYSFEHFRNMSETYEWQYTAEGSFWGRC